MNNEYFCVYKLVKQGVVLYAGQTTNLPFRVKQHRVEKDYDEVWYCVLSSYSEMCNVERNLISALKPPLNKSAGIVRYEENYEEDLSSLVFKLYEGEVECGEWRMNHRVLNYPVTQETKRNFSTKRLILSTHLVKDSTEHKIRNECKILYLTLYSFLDRDCMCYLSQKEIAMYSNIPLGSVKKLLKNMEGMGLIGIMKPTNKHSVYELLDLSSEAVTLVNNNL